MLNTSFGAFMNRVRLCLLVVLGLWLGVVDKAAAKTPAFSFAADTALVSVNESDYYKLTSLPVPEDIVLEVGGMTVLPDGRLAVSTRRGEIWLIENPYMANGSVPHFKRFARGLHEPLGLTYTDGVFYANQRGELTRMIDTDGDERADRYEAVATWPLAGNYHEYSYGPLVMPNGNLLVTLNLAWVGHGASLAKWSGWMLEVSPDGKVMPYATGMRSPAGYGINASGDIFYAENQGDWVGSGRMTHVEKGDFTGNPAGLKWTDDPRSPLDLKPEDVPDTGEPMHEVAKKVPELKEPALWFPQGVMGISTSDILADTIGSAFGPFENQLFIGDQGHSKIMRAFMEKVDGKYQGALFPFREGLSSGVLRMRWGRDGSMFVGMTNRGWASTGKEPFGIDRLAWTGKMPLEIKEMRAKSDGFELVFTRPVDRKLASDPSNYNLTGFTYKYHSSYGSPVVGEKNTPVQKVWVSEDGKKVRLVVEGLREGYVHELKVENLRSEKGIPLLHEEAYYTLNSIPSGPSLADAVTGGTVVTASNSRPSEGSIVQASVTSSSTNQPKHQTEMPDSWTNGPDQTITITPEPGLTFDKTSFQVPAGAKVKLVFNNDDDMLHNLVITLPGQLQAVAEAAMDLGLSGQEENYVPASNDVLFYTEILQPETSQTVYFTAPEKAGDYDYVCTFPGHWQSMQGTMKVVER